MSTVEKPVESASSRARSKREWVFAEAMPTEPTARVEEEDVVKEIDAKLNFTLRHADCPQLFTRVGEQCVSIFYIGNVSRVFTIVSFL